MKIVRKVAMVLAVLSLLLTFLLAGPVLAVSLPPIADAGPDQTLEQTSHAGAEVTLDGSASSSPVGDPLTYEWTWDGELETGVGPTIVLPLGTTTVTLIVTDTFGQVDSDTVDITVVDTTPPVVACLESVNPHGNKTPPAGSTTLPGPKGGQNEDGFYQLTAVDICDANPQIFISDASGVAFGPFSSGDVVKITGEGRGSSGPYHPGL
jgi:hypothetical protein